MIAGLYGIFVCKSKHPLKYQEIFFYDLKATYCMNLRCVGTPLPSKIFSSKLLYILVFTSHTCHGQRLLIISCWRYGSLMKLLALWFTNECAGEMRPPTRSLTRTRSVAPASPMFTSCHSSSCAGNFI